MDKIKLAVQSRESEKTPNQLRREGKVPATLYGRGVASESVQVDGREFGRLPAAAYSHMIELENNGKATNAVIRQVQRKAVNQQILNIEFYRVNMERLINMSVPLKFVGSSTAVAEGGQLFEGFQEVHIESLPGDIPDFVEVDLSLLKAIDQTIHFSDLKLPKGVKITNPLEEVVARVVAPRSSGEDKKGADKDKEKEKAAS